MPALLRPPLACNPRSRVRREQAQRRRRLRRRRRRLRGRRPVRAGGCAPARPPARPPARLAAAGCTRAHSQAPAGQLPRPRPSGSPLSPTCHPLHTHPPPPAATTIAAGMAATVAAAMAGGGRALGRAPWSAAAAPRATTARARRGRRGAAPRPCAGAAPAPRAATAAAAARRTVGAAARRRGARPRAPARLATELLAGPAAVPAPAA